MESEYTTHFRAHSYMGHVYMLLLYIGYMISKSYPLRKVEPKHLDYKMNTSFTMKILGGFFFSFWNITDIFKHRCKFVTLYEHLPSAGRYWWYRDKRGGHMNKNKKKCFIRSKATWNLCVCNTNAQYVNSCKTVTLAFGKCLKVLNNKQLKYKYNKQDIFKVAFFFPHTKKPSLLTRQN